MAEILTGMFVWPAPNILYKTDEVWRQGRWQPSR